MIRSLKAVATVTLMMVFAVSCNKPDVPNDNGGVLDGHDYVDLGLPSGTLWATCNVGAETPEGYGDCFAWGEVVPKDVYDWRSYKYGNFVNEHYELNKYCTDSFYGLDGFIDSLTVLEPIDDAATVNWGADWRTPTREEWEELFRNATCTWTTQNGVNGRLFTASNGKSIFLPAAGYWWDSWYNYAGFGIYWSSSLNTDYQNRAWSFYFTTDNSHVCGSNDRNRGQSIRPVRTVK